MSKETFEDWYKSEYIPLDLFDQKGTGRLAWSHQQTKLDQKDARIKELEEENAKYAEDVLDMMNRHDHQIKEANEVIDAYADEDSWDDYGDYPSIQWADRNELGYEKAREYQAKYKEK